MTGALNFPAPDGALLPFGVESDCGALVAEAEDLQAARVAVRCLLTSDEDADAGYVRLHVVGPGDRRLETAEVESSSGSIRWRSSDLVRRYDGRAA